MRTYNMIKVLAVIIIFSLSTSCSKSIQTFNNDKMTIALTNSIKIDQPIKKLYISGETGKINLQVWKDKIFRFETAVYQINTLENKEIKSDKDFIEYRIEDNGIFNIRTGHKFKENDVVDISLYMTEDVRSLEIDIGYGSIIIHDDFRADFKAVVNNADISFKKINGKLELNANKSNIEVQSGRLDIGSYIKIEKGNINTNVDFFNSGTYTIETGRGNVNINISKNEDAIFYTSGLININDSVQSKSIISAKDNVLVEARLGEINIVRESN